jgi:polysaccharide export outer membrane protein
MLTPEFNQTVTVQPDGYITLRNVGDLRQQGHTLPELTESIKMAYSKILHDPVISVDPKDFEKPYFVVGGQVGKPGKFDWRGDVTSRKRLPWLAASQTRPNTRKCFYSGAYRISGPKPGLST